MTALVRDDAALMSTYPASAVRFVRGVGTRLFDEEGRSYLDFLSGIAVTSLGHCNPAVREALVAQSEKLWHVSNLFSNELSGRLAGELDELVTGGSGERGQVFFANSGAEANECALKLVRRAAGPRRHVVVSALGSFHGRTLATLHATGQPAKHAPFQPLPEGFTHVPYGDVAALADAAEDRGVGAVFLDAIQGEGGVVPAPPGYLRDVRALCDEGGILLVLDEVQTGLGRTGDWFAFQHDEISPDIVTVAKALGNGMPIGACWARTHVAKAFVPGDHGSTFGGQPLACSAALATLSELRRIGAPDRARALGKRLCDGLATLSRVASVRGRGLLLGAVLAKPFSGRANEVVSQALSAGLVLNAPTPDVIRFAPPLTVSHDEIDEALDLLEGVFS